MITSTDNAQVKHLVQLTKKAKVRRETGTFIVEGIRMFREVPEDRLDRLYVSETFLEDNPQEDLLQHAEYEVLSDKVFGHVSDTVTPQGVLCVVKQKKYSLEDLKPKDRPAHILLLEGLQDPGNLGTIFRTAEGAGVTGIIMSKETVDLYNPKTIRSTMGSIYRMPHLVTDDLLEVAAKLQSEGVMLTATDLTGTCDYDDLDYSGDCGFFIGNEGNGLSRQAAMAADHRILIPMEGQVESLNAAIAAAICMYEVKRQRK